MIDKFREVESNLNCTCFCDLCYYTFNFCVVISLVCQERKLPFKVVFFFCINFPFIHKLFTKIFAKVVDKCYRWEYIINRVSTHTMRVLTGAKTEKEVRLWQNLQDVSNKYLQ